MHSRFFRSTLLFFLSFSALFDFVLASIPPSSFFSQASSSSPPSSLPANIPLRNASEFTIVCRIGGGKFSDVFLAEENDHNDKDDRALVVLKVLKPISAKKIRRELQMLSACEHLPYVTTALGIVKGRNTTSFVLEKAGGENGRWFCHFPGNEEEARDYWNKRSGTSSTKKIRLKEKESSGNRESINVLPSSTSPTFSWLSIDEIKLYMYKLLHAILSLHTRNIMHRDIKPRNVIITRGDATSSVQSLTLLDLGLAEYIHESNQRYNVRVASRNYKGPELLIGNEYYDYSLDLWGAGCILAGLLFRREPFFRGRDNIDQLSKIVTFLGTDELDEYCDDCDVKLSKELRRVTRGYRARDWRAYAKKRGEQMMKNDGSGDESFSSHQGVNNNMIIDVDGIDLLEKLLVYHGERRLSARQAIKHPFFDAVRHQL
jgi:casein kinase II subunit alpha